MVCIIEDALIINQNNICKKLIKPNLLYDMEMVRKHMILAKYLNPLV